MFKSVAYLGKSWNNLAEEEGFSPRKAFSSIVALINASSMNHKAYSCDLILEIKLYDWNKNYLIKWE